MFFYLHGVEVQFPNKYTYPTLLISTSSCGSAQDTKVQTRSFMLMKFSMKRGIRGWHTRSYISTSFPNYLGVESYRQKMPHSQSPLCGPKISPL